MMLPRAPKAVVFDMDGLLFDTETICREAMIATSARLGLELPDAVFLAMVGLPAEPSRVLLRDHYGSSFDVEAFWLGVSEDFHRRIDGRAFLKAGVIELLEVLDGAGLRRVIATSSHHRDVQRNLTAHKLEQRFHGIVAHGDYERGKPDPEPFLKAAAKLGVAPEDCLALEDSHNGVRAAAAAGMMTIMVPDLLAPTEEIRGLCIRVARDLHEVCTLFLAAAPLKIDGA